MKQRGEQVEGGEWMLPDEPWDPLPSWDEPEPEQWGPLPDEPWDPLPSWGDEYAPEPRASPEAAKRLQREKTITANREAVRKQRETQKAILKNGHI